MSIADNFHRIQERISRAAESAGRRPDEITLVGVTKYVGPKEAAELATAGCHDLGESRPQELWTKAEALCSKRVGPPSPPPTHCHLIAHLQRNKAARTPPLVTLTHSADNELLLTAINEAHAESANR